MATGWARKRGIRFIKRKKEDGWINAPKKPFIRINGLFLAAVIVTEKRVVAFHFYGAGPGGKRMQIRRQNIDITGIYPTLPPKSPPLLFPS
jgi:hypothetical protein